MTTRRSTTECLNSAGIPFRKQHLLVKYTQLTADGIDDATTTGNDGTGGSPGKAGTNINLDNQRQVIDQEIVNFHDANGRDATNIIDETD